jgi:hypothetical protein
MADTISINLIEKQAIIDNWRFWDQYDEVKLAKLYPNKDFKIIETILTIDTSTSNTLTESTEPSNVCLDFTTQKQVYLRSDNAADTSKQIDVIGQKGDGSVGKFTLTTDGTDGTTPVDVGEWNFISIAIKNDTFAGNAILDDDGLGGTVYFTCPLGATSTLGILALPSGYDGYVMDGYAVATAVPGAATNGNIIELSNSWTELINTEHIKGEIQRYKHLGETPGRITFKTAFLTAVTKMKVFVRFLIYEAEGA